MNILITGASKGIGKALAYEFASHGHTLVLCARTEDLLAENANEIKEKYQVDVDFLAMDLFAEEADKQLIAWLEERKIEVDVLVNNVGLGYLGDFTTMTRDSVDTTMQLNMRLLTRLTLHFAQQFRERRKGYILQVASTAAFIPGPHMALYYASKSFVLSLSRAIEYEMRSDGVKVSTLCPGPTKTNFFKVSGVENTRLAGGIIGLMQADQVAKIAYKGLMRGKPVIIPGLMNKIITFTTRFSPMNLILWISRQLLQRRKTTE